MSDWLRPEQPCVAACLRRMRDAAAREGWGPIPSDRTLRRRLEAALPRAVKVAAREGLRAAARHNARPGRKGGVCAGRSFDATFAERYAQAVVARPTAAQLRLFRLAAKRVAARPPSGEIEIAGARWWHPELVAHAGRRVTVRFDPDALSRPAAVYDADDRLICEAEAVADVPFDSLEAARPERDRDGLAQIQSRIGYRILRRAPAAGDAEAICDAWGLEDGEARRAALALARLPGALRTLVKTLQIAALDAAGRGGAITAAGLRAAHARRASNEDLAQEVR